MGRHIMGWWQKMTSFFKKEDKAEYKTVRARTKKGKFVADDPNTPDVNEAYMKVKKKKKK